jgi:glycosyltransferase involved in cell wall biosynthesis
MLLANAFRPDPRVAREASILVQNGYQVSVVCWDRKAEMPERETVKGFEIVRVQNVRSFYGSGWRQVFYLPRFWRKAIHVAMEMQPDAIHCHDLDTLYAGWRIKKHLDCPLVYDAHENYPALMSLYLPKVFLRALICWENWLLPHTDIIITASSVLRDEYLTRGYDAAVNLGNFHDIGLYAAVEESEVLAVRAKLGISPGELMAAYIGGFTPGRMLVQFIETAPLLPDVPFHLWGDGPDREVVEQAATPYSNVSYNGWLEADELPVHFKAADIIYYCLRPDYQGAVYNAPNTLSQAMAAGRPIIANDVGDLGRIVRETKCGLLLSKVSPETIADAIEQLQNPTTRAQLGENALRAAKDTYNLATVQNHLVDLYQELLY